MFSEAYTATTMQHLQHHLVKYISCSDWKVIYSDQVIYNNGPFQRSHIMYSNINQNNLQFGRDTPGNLHDDYNQRLHHRGLTPLVTQTIMHFLSGSDLLIQEMAEQP